MKNKDEKTLYVLQRQDWRCNICKKDIGYFTFSIALFDIDHIKRSSRGGSDECSNLQALCTQCHRIKTSLEIKRDTIVRFKKFFLKIVKANGFEIRTSNTTCTLCGKATYSFYSNDCEQYCSLECIIYGIGNDRVLSIMEGNTEHFAILKKEYSKMFPTL